METRFGTANAVVRLLTEEHGLLKTLESNAVKANAEMDANANAELDANDTNTSATAPYRFSLLLSLLEPEESPVNAKKYSSTDEEEKEKIEEKEGEEKEGEEKEGKVDTAVSSSGSGGLAGAAGGEEGGGEEGGEKKGEEKKGGHDGLFDRVKLYRRDRLEIGKPAPPIIAVQGDGQKVIAAFEDGCIVSWDADSTSTNFELQV